VVDTVERSDGADRRRFGAQVSRFAWCDDFSARERVLAAGDRRLDRLIDADEFIDPQDWQALRGVLERSANRLITCDLRLPFWGNGRF